MSHSAGLKASRFKQSFCARGWTQQLGNQENKLITQRQCETGLYKKHHLYDQTASIGFDAQSGTLISSLWARLFIWKLCPDIAGLVHMWLRPCRLLAVTCATQPDNLPLGQKELHRRHRPWTSIENDSREPARG